MNNKKKKTGVLTLILSYVLSLLLVVLAALGVVQITLCNPGFLKTQVINSGFCDSALAELQENFISYGSASGFSAEVMTGIIQKERVQTDMFAAVDATYAGKRDLPDYTSFSQNAYDIFAADVESRGYTVTQDVQEGLQLLADTCAQDYTNHVNVPLASYLAPLLVKLNSVMWIPLAVALLLTAMAVVVIIITESDPEKRLKACIYSSTAGFTACVLMPIIAALTIKLQNLNISPQSLKLLIGKYYSSTLSAFFYFAIMYAVVIAALAITLKMLYKREREIYAERKIDRIANENTFGATRQKTAPKAQPQQTKTAPTGKNVRTFGNSDEGNRKK